MSPGIFALLRALVREVLKYEARGESATQTLLSKFSGRSEIGQCEKRNSTLMQVGSHAGSLTEKPIGTHMEPRWMR